MSRTPGFTLIELIVALAIFEVVFLGVAGLLHSSLRAHARAVVLEQVAGEAGTVTDSLSRTLAVTSGTRAYSWGELRWDATRVVARDSTGTVVADIPLVARGMP